MAIPVQSFVNVEDLVFSVDLVSQPQNHLHLITGVAIIGFTGSPADQGNWTRDTVSFDLRAPDGTTLRFANEVTASAIAFPSTVVNVGTEDIGFGVDRVSTTVSPPDMNKTHTVTLTANLAVRNMKGTILRLGFQANVWERPPVR